MILPRRQPPVYSPVSWGDVAGAARACLFSRSDPRDHLADALRRRYGAHVALLTGSGTQALQLALEVSRAAVGEPAPIVALPSFSCFDVASAAVGAGVRVTFYDIDPATLGPDLDSLRHALCRVRASIVVISPLYGVPVDWDVVESLAAECGALVIEDAAQGFGASWRERPLGSFGPLSVLSFGRGKGWTGGSGGALLLSWRPPRSPVLKNTGPVAEVRVALQALGQAVLGHPGAYALPAALPWLGLGTTRYRPPRVPCGMTRAGAALLLASQGAAEVEAAVRRAAGNTLRAWAEAVNHAGNITPLADATPGYLRFPLRMAGGIRGLSSPVSAGRVGVAASYPAPLPSLPALRALCVGEPTRCPGATELAQELVTLPTHSLLSREDWHPLLGLLRASVERGRVARPWRAEPVVRVTRAGHATQC